MRRHNTAPRLLRLLVRTLAGASGAASKDEYYVALASIPGFLGSAPDVKFWRLELERISADPNRDTVEYQNQVFETLFPDHEAKGILERAAKEFGGPDEQLQLLLDLPLEISDIRWECLKSKELRFSPLRTTAFRHVGNLTATNTERKGRGRILVICAHPQNAGLDIREGLKLEWDALKLQENALGRQNIVLSWIWHDEIPTRKRVSEELQKLGEDEVLEGIYFMGHGDRARERSFLCFSDANNQLDPVNPEQFLKLVRTREAERLCNWLVFNTCHSAAGDAKWPLSNLAYTVATLGMIPLVVGFPAQVFNRPAIKFGEGFFKTIAEGIEPRIWLADCQENLRLTQQPPAVFDQAVVFLRLPEQAPKEEFSSRSRPVESLLEENSEAPGAPSQVAGPHAAHASSTRPETSASLGVEPVSKRSEKTGIELMLVQAGNARQGLNHTQRQLLLKTLGRFNWAPGALKKLLDAQPSGDIPVPQFWLSRYLITNEDYERFATETKHKSQAEVEQKPDWREFLEKYPNHPVVRVSRTDAETYCKWAGGRLPALAEWQRACRGDEGLLYPWGTSFEATSCNCLESGHGRTTPVTEYERVPSPFGCVDLVGNVEEWTSSKKDDSLCAVIGGSFEMVCEVYGLPITQRQAATNFFSQETGFRLAFD